MLVIERAAGDVAQLRTRAAGEKNALRRDRYRAVLLSIEGKEANDIAAALGRARRSVQDWSYAYRDGGVDAIQSRPRTGRTPKLPRDREADLKARLDAGPLPEDHVCTSYCVCRGTPGREPRLAHTRAIVPVEVVDDLFLKFPARPDPPWGDAALGRANGSPSGAAACRCPRANRACRSDGERAGGCLH